MHLIEIDLLRGGAPTVAFPSTGLRFRLPFDYIVSLSRASNREQVAYWSFVLGDRLPRVSVPLQPGFDDIVEDLQDVFESTYDRGAFDRTVDYSEPLHPALSAEDAFWVAERIRTAPLTV